MKKNVLKVAGVFCAGLLVAVLWSSVSAFAKSDSEKEKSGADINMQLENEEAGLVEEEDVLWDNLEELEDDFGDVQLRIDQILNQGNDAEYFQKSAQEIKALLIQAEDSLEKEDWNKAKGDMDSALLKLKSLNESVLISQSAEYFGEDEEWENGEPEVVSQESVQKQESVQQQDTQEPEKKKSGLAGMVSGLFSWIAGLFS